MINVKKIGKWVGIVFLLILLSLLVYAFYPLVSLAVYMLSQLAWTLLDIAIAAIIVRLAAYLIQLALGKKKLQIPQALKALRQKLATPATTEQPKKQQKVSTKLER